MHPLNNQYIYVSTFKTMKSTIKSVIYIATLLCSFLVATLSTSCNQSSGNQQENTTVSLMEGLDTQQIASGETWLNGIFQCPDGKGYCFPDEEKVLTEQYYQFFIESVAMFEYPDFETEEERVNAEKVYNNKWENTYPLGNEVWAPFGRGNGIGAGDKLQNVTITHLSDLKFTALIDYGEGNVFFNALLLVPSGNAFLIDYIETMEIDIQEGEMNLPFLQNLTLAKFQLGANPTDAKRLLGKPNSESAKTGPLEVSGYIDEDYIVTTTTMEYEGIKLLYDDQRMIHATVDKPGKQFGWIICGDKNCDKDFLMQKFRLTEEDVYDNDEGDKTLVMNWEIFSLVVLLDADNLVKTIEFNAGP